ncbi:MAG: hypothetical protein H6711_26020 [Myxococcales bacterium]|nr:hypothetical protein [Myxococcales bacterium]
MLARAPLVPVLALLAACQVETVDAFMEEAAEVSCKRFRKCGGADFERDFGDLAGCREDLEAQIQNMADAFLEAGCTYDADEGQACVDVIRERRRSCGEADNEAINAACEGVLTCAEGQRAATHLDAWPPATLRAR